MRRQAQDVATNLPGMTNREELPTAVNVPVQLIKHIARVLRANEFEQEALDVIALLPQPKPRFVAVDLNKIGSVGDGEAIGWGAYQILSEQPDLLTLIDGVVDNWDDEDHGELMKRKIRKALGVTE